MKFWVFFLSLIRIRIQPSKKDIDPCGFGSTTPPKIMGTHMPILIQFSLSYLTISAVDHIVAGLPILVLGHLPAHIAVVVDGRQCRPDHSL
jgi:hypothetical protein